MRSRYNRNMRALGGRAGFSAVLLLLLSGCAGTYEKVSVKPANERKAAPDFTLRDANGAPVKLSDFKGKVVLLNFWATWCGPCKVEIPWFMSFQQQYKDRDFVVLGVSLDDEGWDVVKPYVNNRKINYRVCLGNEETSQLYGGIESLPTTFVIDRDGKIASRHIGLVSKSTYEKEILNLLDGKAEPHAD